MFNILHAAIAITTISVGTQTPTTSSPAATATPVRPVDKLICRASETMGSRLQRKRICMTAAQWRETARDGADDLDRRLRGVHVEASGG